MDDPKNLVTLLAEAGALFRYYETQHRAKGTDDALAKAERNAEIAGRIEAALAAHPSTLFVFVDAGELEALVKDAARLKWMLDNKGLVLDDCADSKPGEKWCVTFANKNRSVVSGPQADNPRSAIDAAMKGTK